MTGWCDGDVVKGFKSLRVTTHASRRKQFGRLDVVIKIAKTKDIIVARRDHAASTDAAAEGPIHRVGIFIGKAEPREQTDALHIRFIELVAPESRAVVMEAVRIGRETTYEHEVLCKDGGVVFVETRAKVVRVGDRNVRMTALRDITERKQHEAEREKLITELKAALAEVKTLSGMIPICGWCKSVRSDQGYWQSVEQYVRSHTDATFSHGMCPSCTEKFKADILKGNPAK
jgi:hypothetical protein